jgi:hypothetical protein
MKYLGLAFLVAGILLFADCTTNVAGNSTQTGNAAVVGILYQADGKTPAPGVRVHIRPKKSLADTSGLGLVKRSAMLAATDSVLTDAAGRFAFDTTIDTGTYVIEAASGNNAIFVDSVPIGNKQATDSLPPDTLKPAGALKGIISLSEGGDPRKVFILAFGIDRFAPVNADGSFKFGNLAAAKYDIRLISSLDNYGVLDTFGVPVRSGDTTNLDTIRLPFTGIPTPQNLKISYDTMKEVVTLTWNKAATALVKSYNVYRRNVDSNTVAVRINASPVVDTVYKDSTGVQDQTYEYRVAAVDTNGTEGVKSAATSTLIASPFEIVDVLITLSGTLGNFDIGRDNKLYIANATSNKIQIYDLSGSKIREWPVEGGFNWPEAYFQSNIAVSDSLQVLLYNNSTHNIQRFDTLGNTLGPLPFFLGDCEGICLHGDTLLLLNQNERKIYAYRTNGDSLFVFNDSWTTSDNLYSMTCDSSGNLLVYGEIGPPANPMAMEVFKADLTQENQFAVNGPNKQYLGAGTISSSEGKMLIAASGMVVCYDLIGNLIFRFSLPQEYYSSLGKATLDSGGNVVVGTKEGIIFRYSR